MAKHSSKNQRNILFSDFYCTKCGQKGIPIIRKVGSEREPGHLKKLYCLYCKEEVNMAEVRSIGKYTLNEFWIEYNYNNFTEDGLRKEPWKQFIAKVRKGRINNANAICNDGGTRLR